MIAPQHRHTFLRLHGFWPRLDNKQFAGPAIFSPFHIHRAMSTMHLGVMRFDLRRPATQLQNFIIGEGKLLTFLNWHRNIFGLFRAMRTIDQLNFFTP